jgi:hypothetical protein
MLLLQEVVVRLDMDALVSKELDAATGAPDACQPYRS